VHCLFEDDGVSRGGAGIYLSSYSTITTDTGFSYAPEAPSVYSGKEKFHNYDKVIGMHGKARESAMAVTVKGKNDNTG
jgi:hypothetical protein